MSAVIIRAMSPEMNELESDKVILKIWTHNWKNTKVRDFLPVPKKTLGFLPLKKNVANCF